MNRLLWMFCLLIPVAALARLGETPKECEARYGKPILAAQPGTGATVFQKDEINISIQFIKGRAAAISYVRHHRAFTADELKSLRAANPKPFDETLNRESTIFTLDTIAWREDVKRQIDQARNLKAHGF